MVGLLGLSNKIGNLCYFISCFQILFFPYIWIYMSVYRLYYMLVYNKNNKSNKMSGVH